ncbi:MAG: fibrobacter succinogenes major paralogous domain-containing protein [Imperialibacter sp.]
MKTASFFILYLLVASAVSAQSPEKMSYQAIIRNGSGNLVANTAIGMRISILQGTVTGTAVYVETQTPTTTASGLISIEIADPATSTVVSGTFAGINWGADAHFLKVEMDLAGGTNYTITGTSQLLSVPYALNAKTAQTVTGLANGKLYLGNGTGAATQVSVSGDATMSNDGTLTIGTNAIGSAEVSDNSLTAADLGTGSVGSDELADGTITNADLNKANIPLSGFGAATATVDMGGYKITGLADPTAAQEAATKAYADVLEAQLKALEDVLIAAGTVKFSDVDGNQYLAVTIGAQVWMAENLKTTKYNDGSAIPLVTGTTVPTTPAYFWYADTPSNGDTYGALYNWYAVNATSNGGKNVCPSGWHVPTDAEWTTMENYLIANGYNYDGTTTGNKYAKSLAASSGWGSSVDAGVPGNTDYASYRNKTGFTALPGGVRDITGSFRFIGNYGFWWSTTEYDASIAWDRGVYNVSSNVYRNNTNKEAGESVRCLRD